jgi:hypothetical protein
MKPRPLWQRDGGLTVSSQVDAIISALCPSPAQCSVAQDPGAGSKRQNKRSTHRSSSDPAQHQKRPRRQPQRSLGCETLYRARLPSTIHARTVRISQVRRPLNATVVRCSRLRGCHEGGLKQETSHPSQPALPFSASLSLSESLERDLALLPLFIIPSGHQGRPSSLSAAATVPSHAQPNSTLPFCPSASSLPNHPSLRPAPCLASDRGWLPKAALVR